MRQVIEGMVAMIFIILLCVTGMDLLNVHMQAGQAKEFRNRVATAIVNSDYDETVMTECMNQAQALNYQLQIELYKRDGSHVSYGENPMDDKTEMVQILLTYKTKLPTLHTGWKQTISVMV